MIDCLIEFLHRCLLEEKCRSDSGYDPVTPYDDGE
jgi:hypothetical protein